jgi:hypothetical protein
MNAVALVLFSLLAQAGPPEASPDARSQAQALLKEGAQYYKHSEFADALKKFEQAYAAFPSPKLFLNIGQANRALGRPVDAIEAFEKFLAQAKDIAPELTAEAKRSVDELSPKVGSLRVDCTLAGAAIAVDGRPEGQAPLADPVRVVPGSHQVTATHPSATPAVENVTVAAGTAETVVLRPLAAVAPVAPALVPPPPPAPVVSAPPPPLDVQAAPPADQVGRERGWWLGRKWTWVAAGSTVVFAGAAAIFGASMQSKFDTLNGSCGSAGKTTVACSDSDVASVTTLKNTANVFWGLAAAVAVTTGVLFWVEGRPVAVAPIAGETTGIVASVRY